MATPSAMRLLGSAAFRGHIPVALSGMWCARQVALLPSGCQPWNRDVCAASEDWFAYCATLAIYLYQMDQHHYEFKLRAIMSEHKRTITAISWSPHCPEVFASASMDGLLIIWNVIERKVVSRLKLIEDTPSFLSWCPDCSDTVTFTSPSGPLYLWTVTETESNVVPHHEAHNFLSEVCLFRWHPQNNGRVVFGHSDGSISIFQPGRKSQKHMLRPEALEGTDEEDPVTALEWDPLSAAYLLVANQGNGLRLLDVDSLTCITCFSLSSIVMTVRCLAWLTTAPGMFITGDSQVGILRVWNVSRPSPLENLKLKKTGFHTLGVFLSPPRNKYQRPKSPCGNRYTSSSSSKSHAVRLAQGHVICCFKDAGVGLYDLGTRKWDFFQDMGHMETIFDCEFKPDNPNLLATASFDGTIKVWDINDMAATAMSPGNEGVIYSLSWAPGDLNCIAGSTSCNGAFIWDINKGTIRIRFNEHGKNRIFSIAWNKNDPKRIATGSADGFCIIHSIEGKVLQRYRHPAAVYGCDWSHTSSNMIATGCEDGNVRVYYLAAGSDQPLKVFKGHTAKVFNVRWSPLREGIFCSGSDDNTVRIWDYTKAACIITLCGHTGPVRGLVWNTEVPYLLVSGSWDSSIRIWDTRSGVCLDIVQVHGADVYGVTCHPRRPFTMASCSRDSTVRLWTLTPLVAPLTLGLLAQRPWEEIIGRLDEAMAPCSPPLLCGNISKDIKQEIEKHGEDVQAKKLCLFSEFFFPLGGSKNLCDLVAVLGDQEESLLPHDYSRGIVHTRHMVKIKMSEAQRLTSTKMHKLGCSIGAPSKEDQLRAAAAIHLRLGQLQRYCELMVELGEWDKALCVAPGVSMRYWKKLMQRRATQLLDEGSDEAIPYCIATGDLTSVVEFFSARGQLADALLVTQATCEGNVQAPIHNHSGSTPPGRPSLGKDNAKLLVQVSTDMAECYLQDGRAIVSACCRLAVDDIEMAMATLVRGNELELAVMVGLVLGDQAAPLTHYSLQLLARRAQALGHWYLAVDLLKQMPKNDMAMVKLCSSTQLCNEELDVLHQKCNLPSLEECALLAQSLHEQGDVLQTVRYTLLSPAPETALEMGLAFVKDVMSRKDWKLQDVLSVLDMLGSIRTKVLLLPQFSKQKNELLILCGYAGAMLAIRRRYITIVAALYEYTRIKSKLLILCGYAGAMLAIRRRYITIVAALYEYTSQLLRWRDVTVPLVVEELALELDAWQSCQGEDVHSSDAQLVLYETLMERVGHEPIRSMVGQDYVTASHLPSHSEVYTSCLNGAMIQGPAVLLEDGKSAIPLNDALMWSKVNPFSPLGTGLHLLPL